jgi:hypothetical protein
MDYEHDLADLFEAARILVTLRANHPAHLPDQISARISSDSWYTVAMVGAPLVPDLVDADPMAVYADPNLLDGCAPAGVVAAWIAGLDAVAEDGDNSPEELAECASLRTTLAAVLPYLVEHRAEDARAGYDRQIADLDREIDRLTARRDAYLALRAGAR